MARLCARCSPVQQHNTQRTACLPAHVHGGNVVLGKQQRYVTESCRTVLHDVPIAGSRAAELQELPHKPAPPRATVCARRGSYAQKPTTEAPGRRVIFGRQIGPGVERGVPSLILRH